MTDIYISIMKSDDKFYITTDKKGIISGFKTKEDGVSSYEKLYMEWHQRSHEASMSACLGYMTFQPSIVKVSGVDEIRKMVGNEPHLFDLSHVSGYMTGIQIPDPAVGQEYWDKGAKPQLIK
jgi:hypothetical protein